MKTDSPSFTIFYQEWLGSGTSLNAGGASTPVDPNTVQKPVQPPAVLDWEEEGGSVKPPEKKPDEKPVPKLPL